MTNNSKSLTALKQQQQISELIRAITKETLRKSLTSIAEAHKGLQKEIIKHVSEFQKLLQGSFESLRRSFRELSPRIREALLLLGEHGWYLDLEMSLPELGELKKTLSEGNVDEAEEALAEYFEGRLDEIEKSISEKFLHRAHLIRAAFNAHRRQEYELSIPIILAQTDGICKEVVNQHLFRKKNKKPRTAIYVDQFATEIYIAALLSPLAVILPINFSESERSAGFNALNRHTVLHGESLDYGSKINSLKAISLINYVVHVLKVEKESPSDSPGQKGIVRN